jgi:hypothetical protein
MSSPLFVASSYEETVAISDILRRQMIAHRQPPISIIPRHVIREGDDK